MNLSKPLIKAIANMGLSAPTEIQVILKYFILFFES